MRYVLIGLCLLPLLSSAGYPGDPPDGCGDELHTICPLRISVCPQGDFETIARGCGGEGAYIEVVIYDGNGVPIAGIPVSDFWMGACGTEYDLAPCGAPFFLADSLTGVDGRTTFSGHVSAGGCVPEGGIYLACQGRSILEWPSCVQRACADIVLVSPDLNGDGRVNLSDLSYFGQSYNKALGDAYYDTCCDYNDDDRCNLSDFAYFASHYQHGCP